MSVKVTLVGNNGEQAVVDNAVDAMITGANVLVVLLPNNARQIFTLSHFITVTVEPIEEPAASGILVPEGTVKA